MSFGSSLRLLIAVPMLAGTGAVAACNGPLGSATCDGNGADTPQDAAQQTLNTMKASSDLNNFAKCAQPSERGQVTGLSALAGNKGITFKIDNATTGKVTNVDADHAKVEMLGTGQICFGDQCSPIEKSGDNNADFVRVNGKWFISFGSSSGSGGTSPSPKGSPSASDSASASDMSGSDMGGTSPSPTP
jgi:hypothetical protein